MQKHPPLYGAMCLLRGFSLLFKPGMKRFIIVPTLINILLFILLFFLCSYLVDYITALLPNWLHWLSWLFWIILLLGGATILIYTFTIFINVIGAPFNSLLAEKIEILITGEKPNQDQGLKDAMKDIPRTLRREGSKIKYSLPRMMALLILFLIPAVNLIASPLWFGFACWMMAIQYLDYPFDNHKIPFKEMKVALRQNFSLSFSFGLSVIIASMIPFVNFLVMPAAVIGATLLWIKIDENTKK